MNADKADRYQRLKRWASVMSLAWTAGVLAALVLTGGTLALRDSRPAWPVPPALPRRSRRSSWSPSTSSCSRPFTSSARYPSTATAVSCSSAWYGLATERFGHWLSGRVKASLVGLVLGVAGAAVTYAALWFYAAWWWVAAGGVFSLAALALTMAGPVLLLPLFHQCRPLEREPLRARLIRLAARAGVPAIGVSEWRLSDRTRKANAALAGLGATRRILVSDTLLSDYTEDEIEVVLAHELAHHAHGDIWKGVAAEMGLIVGACFVAGRVLARAVPALPLTGPADVAGLPVLLLTALALAGGGPARYERAFARGTERRADRFALDLTGNPAAFASAMRRLAFQNLAEPRPSRLTQWLFAATRRSTSGWTWPAGGAPGPRDTLLPPVVVPLAVRPNRRRPAGCRPPAPARSPRSSGSRALRLSRILPVGSMLMTLTRICSPSLSSSRTSFTRWFAISETCSRPSVPGMISTNAPKSVMRWTLPR